MNDRICKCDICGQYFTNDEIVVIHEKGCYETDYGVEPDFTGYQYAGDGRKRNACQNQGKSRMAEYSGDFPNIG